MQQIVGTYGRETALRPSGEQGREYSAYAMDSGGSGLNFWQVRLNNGLVAEMGYDEDPAKAAQQAQAALKRRTGYEIPFLSTGGLF